jgi:mono/diheme cytochrome c family protein
MQGRWRIILATVVIAYAAAILAGVGFIYAGAYDIAATDAHWGITRWVMETARVRSIRVHATGVAVPAGLDAPANLPIGVAHYAEHCAVCHGAPGVPKGDVAQGMYPQPPELALAAQQYSDAELFWIVKHGIKMTGMPAWADHGDAELWATVAFVKKLPSMSEAAYAKLVMENAMRGKAHRPGGEAASPAAGGAPAGHEHH